MPPPVGARSRAATKNVAMNCCSATAAPDSTADRGPPNQDHELLLASRPVGDRLLQTDLAVPAMHCGGCIRKIETGLGALPGVEHVRVNLSTRRVAIHWHDEGRAPPVFETLRALGYDAHLYDVGPDEKDLVLAELVRALAVAGFASANIMLLSVSVWAGADDATRDLFHWISAAVAFPALIYSGRIFFRSAWRSLRHGQINMDVPISVGVSLAFALSLYDTIHHGAYAYFDAAISLLFFLLVGRTLDHVMREKARDAVKGLARLAARGAMVVQADGTRAYMPVNEIAPGMTILLAAGERVPVDARVEAGLSDLDVSLVSGESAPQPVSAGSVLRAGTLNLTGPLTLKATAAAKESFLARMLALIETVESGKAGYRRLADRAARLYGPLVHLAALLTFIGWMAATGDLHRAVTIAIAVLIITCPCALGLAVPMVQVVAARRLFENGIMVRTGSAMERLAEIDTVLFDKTGTLTTGSLQLMAESGLNAEHLDIASSMAAHSRHPLARALAEAGRERDIPPVQLERIAEFPGLGLEAAAGANVYRLGRPGWASDDGDGPADGMDSSSTVLSLNGRLVAAFRFDDHTRADAREAVAALTRAGLALEIISGDRLPVVRRIAADLGVTRFNAEVLPHEKAARVQSAVGQGHKALMVGDGLNDAPALAAAHVSMAPAGAADVGRNAADFVFLRESLMAVPLAIAVSREAAALIRQNFAFAVAYNLVAVPFAVAGHVTPLIAALAMSGSSIAVVANALRLRRGSRDRRRGEATRQTRRRALAVEAAE
jgi:Cu2+-exporting ATPase